MAGQKFDQDKLPLGLIPKASLEAQAEALTVGARKYGRHNWREGLLFSRYIDAIMRHLAAWAEGESRCPKDGQRHLGAILACAGFLAHMEAHPEEYAHLDDRPHDTSKENFSPTPSKPDRCPDWPGVETDPSPEYWQGDEPEFSKAGAALARLRGD